MTKARLSIEDIIKICKERKETLITKTGKA